jgi:hypothetical protein
MEILAKKRKQPETETTPTYEIFRSFCILGNVTEDQVDDSCSLVAMNGRKIGLIPDLKFMVEARREITKFPCKVEEHPMLRGIAIALEKLMTISPSLFDFNMFSDGFLPNDVIRLILQMYKDDGGNLRIRNVSKKFRDLSTNVKLFPGLENVQLACTPMKRLYCLFMLHFVVLGCVKRLCFGDPGQTSYVLKHDKKGITLKRIVFSEPCFSGYSDDILMIRLGDDIQKYFEVVMSLYTRELTYDAIIRPSNHSVYDPNSEDSFTLREFKNGLQKMDFKIALRDLFIKYKIDF